MWKNKNHFMYASLINPLLCIFFCDWKDWNKFLKIITVPLCFLYTLRTASPFKFFHYQHNNKITKILTWIVLCFIFFLSCNKINTNLIIHTHQTILNFNKCLYISYVISNIRFFMNTNSLNIPKLCKPGFQQTDSDLSH